MNKVSGTCIAILLALLLLPVESSAQSRRDKEQTYVLEQPYEVTKIAPPQGERVRNVILMIGDGMSLMHVYSAWTANRGKLFLDNCQAVGLSKTYCADRLITDSGAGGTAIATGQKTNYHYVGVDTQGRPLKSLVDWAAGEGKSTGIAVTCRLWDATPADFCCHNKDRDAEAEIVADYVNCKADYVFGGGAKLFENREDGRDLFEELRGKGFQTPRTWEELAAIHSGKVFAVPYPKDTPLPAERGDLLARASLKGIELLNQNKNGFFMMIEGSQLDDYGHFNDLDLLMQETHDFDRTIGAVYEWAAKDGETLVVVTADHETGGLTLVDGDLKEGRIVCKFSTGGHSGVMVPVYAFGPGAEEFTGIYENTAIFDKIKKLLEAQSCGNEEKYRLPYKNTYVKEPLVTENEYRVAKPETIVPKSFEEARQILPNPIWGGHDKELEMYWKAWEMAIGNIRAPQAGSGFVSSYLDTAYNGNIFMWDSSFILMFARYGTRFFPFQNTLDNFYAKQHPDGFICREIKADGSDCFERYDPVSTGPNLMPWCEMVYFHQFGDTERLHKVFPVLCAYYKWLKLNRTWRNGTYWSSGWGTGMDNMPRVPSEYSPIYSHGHMIWLDTNLQQLFTANLLLEMGFYLERWQEIEEFEDEADMLGKYIRDNLWDDKSGFLYDRYADGTLCKTKGIGAYWALFTDVLDSVQLDRMVKELDNPATFNRKHRIPSLSADHPKYKENGRYWQGGVWPGTNYMVMQGLLRKGYGRLAREICLNHYARVFEVYKKTGTFWEYYAPESAEPGFMARDNFVGWAGLPPIAGLIEFIIGIRGDYVKKQIVWDMNLTEENGIERYPFGPGGLVSLKAEARRSASVEPRITVDSNIDFELCIFYGGKEKKIHVTSGKHTY